MTRTVTGGSSRRARASRTARPLFAASRSRHWSFTGWHDPLVAPSGGLAVAKAIPGARFVGFSGMGHDLPRELWPEFVLQIAALAALAEQRQASDHQQASQT